MACDCSPGEVLASLVGLAPGPGGYDDLVSVDPLRDDEPARLDVMETEHLRLTPLVADHATEMTEVLSDPTIYEFTGGEPPTEADLRSRYEFLEGRRSPDGTESWLNWIVFELATGSAVGVMQATVFDDGTKADVAWIIAPPWQGRGYAGDAAVALVDWLGARSVEQVTAHIHPRHQASRRVAAAAGLRETEFFHDGEQQWVRRFGDS